MTRLTYPEVGATRTAPPFPTGYQHLSVRTVLGPGVFGPAAEALLTWRMHHAIGVRPRTSADRAAVGVRVTCRVGLGPLSFTAPCEVVCVVEDEHMAGFAYGTLTGHPECGEESFMVSRAEDDLACLTVSAFSRPASWYARAAGPLVPVLQRAYARRCGAALKRLSA